MNVLTCNRPKTSGKQLKNKFNYFKDFCIMKLRYNKFHK